LGWGWWNKGGAKLRLRPDLIFGAGGIDAIRDENIAALIIEKFGRSGNSALPLGEIRFVRDWEKECNLSAMKSARPEFPEKLDDESKPPLRKLAAKFTANFLRHICCHSRDA
jgi:hypothetical protein